jgi:hypothetical protein
MQCRPKGKSLCGIPVADRREPPIDTELAELYAKRASEIIRLADVREKHQRRKAVTEPHPVFPVEGGAA